MSNRNMSQIVIGLAVVVLLSVGCGPQETVPPATSPAEAPETTSTPIPSAPTSTPVPSTPTSTPIPPTPTLMPTPTLAPLTLAAQQLYPFDARIKRGVWEALVAQDQNELDQVALNLEELRADLEAVETLGSPEAQRVQETGVKAINALIDMCRNISLAKINGVNQAIDSYSAAWSTLMAEVETPPADTSIDFGDGQLVLTIYRDEQFDICIMNTDGTKLTNLTDDEEVDMNPVWSPDGTQIAFASRRGDDEVVDIYFIDIEDTEMTNLTSDEAYDSSPDWSPDGTQIVFASDRDGDSDIYVMNTDGTDVTNLTNNEASDGSPAWSPDGTQIAFVSDRDGDEEIYIMGIDGVDVTSLTSNDASDESPVWSPDGKQIVFVSDRDGNDEIYVMNIDGTGATNLTNNEASDTGPVWSPDGAWILFTSDRFFNSDFFAVLADGKTGAIRVTDTDWTGFISDWLP